jgi:hypothetical protein
MKHRTQSILEKNFLIFNIILFLFSVPSLKPSTSNQKEVITASLNFAPPSFSTAEQTFKKIYSGTLSISDAQTQPWFESYDQLYKKINGNISDSDITEMLSNLQQQLITPDEANTQFQKAQATLKENTDSLLNS